MAVNTYKSLKCYTKMEDKYKQSFDRLVEYYGTKLNKGCPIGTTLYTLHDFDKHCINIYKIISNIILCNIDFLTAKELYLLNISVLMHDISMSTNMHWNRKKHSQESAEYVQEESDNTSSVLSNEKSQKCLSINDINSIKNIITAHSDIKDGSVLDSENGIYNSSLEFKDASEVNSKLLAAILRLADELDVTSDRIGDETFPNQLSDEDDNERISKKHWENLHYFSQIKFDAEDATKLILYCDDNYLTKNIDNASNITERIKSILNKINIELEKLNKEVFNKHECSGLNFHCQKVEYYTKLKEYSSNPIESFNYSEIAAPLCSQQSTNNEGDESFPKIICEETSKFITNEIYKRGLITGGHHIINEKYCSRDWIDVSELIETDVISKEIISKISHHCRENFLNEDLLIIGLDIDGSIIASIVAANLHLPFQYIIPAKSSNSHSGHDIAFNLPVGKKVVLITDVISTFDTVKTAIKKYKLDVSVEAIYSILYRKTNKNINVSKNLKSICYCLNKEFDIEVFESSNCKHHNKETCLSKIKRR